MKKSIVFWQFIGFAFVCVAGTILHFVFDWSGENIVIGLFSAVNESIWEHIKLLYFPMLVFAFVENKFLVSEHRNFWFAKTVGFIIGILLIPALYYTYTGAFGVKADWFNIMIFFITAFVVFFTETKIIKSSREYRISPTVLKAFILILGALLVIFTFSPPKAPLFQDPINGTYGIWRVS